MSTNLKYALVSGKIIQYKADSLECKPSEYNEDYMMVHYTDPCGIHCITTPENFIKGTYEDLIAIINAEEAALKAKINAVLDAYPMATSTEKKIMEYMVMDGYDPDDLTYDEIQEVTQGTIRYCEFNASLRDAYMDYMH